MSAFLTLLFETLTLLTYAQICESGRDEFRYCRQAWAPYANRRTAGATGRVTGEVATQEANQAACHATENHSTTAANVLQCDPSILIDLGPRPTPQSCGTPSGRGCLLASAASDLRRVDPSLRSQFVGPSRDFPCATQYAVNEGAQMLSRIHQSFNQEYKPWVSQMGCCPPPTGRPGCIESGHDSHKSGRDMDLQIHVKDTTRRPTRNLSNPAISLILLQETASTPAVQQVIVGRGEATRICTLLKSQNNQRLPNPVPAWFSKVLIDPPGNREHSGHLHIRFNCAPNDVVCSREPAHTSKLPLSSLCH